VPGREAFAAPRVFRRQQVPAKNFPRDRFVGDVLDSQRGARSDEKRPASQRAIDPSVDCRVRT
jgi:hypothetical protein